jgi:Aminotransferase class-III
MPSPRPRSPWLRGRAEPLEEIVMTGPPPSTVPLETLDKERVLHPATSIADHLRTGPRIMAEGAGLTLTDTTGRKYLDAVAGLWCVAIGYGRTEVAEAMAAQSRRLAFYHTFTSMSNEPQIHLADRLLTLAPGRMSKVFLRHLGIGGERHPGQARVVLQQPPRPTAQEEDHRAARGLSRHHGGGG